MRRTAVATPVAKRNKLRMDASLLSLWTRAIAISAHIACRYKQNHFIPVTCDWLIVRRWRRASIAFCRALTIACWAICWPSPICALIAIALVHSDNGLASILSMFLFATGVATAVLLIS